MKVLSFGVRMHNAMQERGPLCVGIDPHPSLLIEWGLRDDKQGLREFCLRHLDALGDYASAFKPQSALFERHGAAGIRVLEEVLATCKQTGALSILDVKRGDIGSTMLAYAQAYLDDKSHLAADAVTLSPFLGFESLRPAIDMARDNSKGVFVLALTSNPEGRNVQHAITNSGSSVAASILDAVRQENHQIAGGGWGHVGVVVGATIGNGLVAAGGHLGGLNGAILSPGFGAQGAGVDEMRSLFTPVQSMVLATSSRAISAHGPDTSDLLTGFQTVKNHILSAMA